MKKALIMKKVHLIIVTTALVFMHLSCKKETREKLKQAKQSVSNVTTMATSAEEIKENIEKLQNATPLTNDQLKTWLPETLEGMNRTSFKTGASSYTGVASIEGTYDTPDTPKHIKDENDKRIANPNKKTFSITLYDGAGPTGGMMISGLGMASKMDFEEETEYKHKKTVSVNGIKAVQTLNKPRSPYYPVKVQLQFVYKNRFGLMISSTNMTEKETWEVLEKIDLDQLVREAS